MASLQCSKCGEGIHYHSVPESIEYIYFSVDVWNRICNTKFDKNNKVMDKSGLYPKLYRSSTIENDYLGMFLKIWKCPACGTLHFFSDDGSVKNVFAKEDMIRVDNYTDEGILFDDYLWDKITENDISNDKLIATQPSYYVRMNSEFLTVSKTSDFSEPEYYKLFCQYG